MEFERRTDRVISKRAFVGRMLRHVGAAALLVAGALLIGVVGYHSIAGFSWIDSFLNAAMILTSMGPVDHVTTDTAKIFAAIYALFSGLVFVTASGVVVAPLLHRVFHRLHLDS